MSILENYDHYWSTLPSMKKEDLFTKYAESAGTRDADYLWQRIKEYHDIDNPDLTESQRQFAKGTCEKFVKIAVENPALYDFVLDTDYDEYWEIMDPENKVENRCRLASEFFIPWIATLVPRAIALEVVYGYGIDIYGEYREIPETDPFLYFTYKNDLFKAIAERGIKTIELLDKQRSKKIGFLAAGMAPEFRHLGLELKKRQSAILVDNDPTINPEDLLKDLPSQDRITYVQEDISKAVAEQKFKGCDAVVANGIICYVWNMFPQLLGAMVSQIKSGGSFIFELYPHHWEWARNRDIKGFYLPLKLFEDSDEAAQAVENATKLFGITKISSYRYYDDFDNEIMIMFRLTMP